MSTFDRNGFAKKADSNRCNGYLDQSYLVRSAPLASFLADPRAAKESGALPLAPPSRPRL
jgi:hypothetical protein